MIGFHSTKKVFASKIVGGGEGFFIASNASSYQHWLWRETCQMVLFFGVS